MKTLFFLLTLPVCLSFINREECGLLSNGTYILSYTYNSTEKDSRLQIRDSSFLQYWDNDDSAKGKIKWGYKCRLVFDYTDAPQNVEGPGRLLADAFGKPCVELNEVSGDTIYFRTTYSGNLHITLNKGWLTRIKQ